MDKQQIYSENLQPNSFKNADESITSGVNDLCDLLHTCNIRSLNATPTKSHHTFDKNLWSTPLMGIENTILPTTLDKFPNSFVTDGEQVTNGSRKADSNALSVDDEVHENNKYVKFTTPSKKSVLVRLVPEEMSQFSKMRNDLLSFDTQSSKKECNDVEADEMFKNTDKPCFKGSDELLDAVYSATKNNSFEAPKSHSVNNSVSKLQNDKSQSLSWDEDEFKNLAESIQRDLGSSSTPSKSVQFEPEEEKSPVKNVEPTPLNNKQKSTRKVHFAEENNYAVIPYIEDDENTFIVNEINVDAESDDSTEFASVTSDLDEDPLHSSKKITHEESDTDCSFASFDSDHTFVGDKESKTTKIPNVVNNEKTIVISANDREVECVNGNHVEFNDILKSELGGSYIPENRKTSDLVNILESPKIVSPLKFNFSDSIEARESILMEGHDESTFFELKIEETIIGDVPSHINNSFQLTQSTKESFVKCELDSSPSQLVDVTDRSNIESSKHEPSIPDIKNRLIENQNTYVTKDQNNHISIANDTTVEPENVEASISPKKETLDTLNDDQSIVKLENEIDKSTSIYAMDKTCSSSTLIGPYSHINELLDVTKAITPDATDEILNFNSEELPHISEAQSTIFYKELSNSNFDVENCDVYEFNNRAEFKKIPEIVKSQESLESTVDNNDVIEKSVVENNQQLNITIISEGIPETVSSHEQKSTSQKTCVYDDTINLLTPLSNSPIQPKLLEKPESTLQQQEIISSVKLPTCLLDTSNPVLRTVQDIRTANLLDLSISGLENLSLMRDISKNDQTTRELNLQNELSKVKLELLEKSTELSKKTFELNEQTKENEKLRVEVDEKSRENYELKEYISEKLIEEKKLKECYLAIYENEKRLRKTVEHYDDLLREKSNQYEKLRECSELFIIKLNEERKTILSGYEKLLKEKNIHH